MVLGLLAIAAIPTAIGVTQTISSQNKEDDPKTEAERMRKFNLECYCEPKSLAARKINGGKIVLRNNKVYINSSTPPKGHVLESFYINYPDPERPLPPPSGMVSSISDDPPMLNWIYVDKDTREVKYGNRTQSRKHVVGSWGWEAGEKGGAGGVTLEGEEGAVAVEMEEGWEVRWEDESGRVPVTGKRTLQISLERKFVELTEKEKEEKEQNNGEEKRTNINFITTNTNIEAKRETTTEPVAGLKSTLEHTKPRNLEPRLEIERTTIARPIQHE